VEAAVNSKAIPDLGKPNIEEPFKVAKDRVIASFEKVYLTQLLAWADGNVSRASRKAKLDRMYLSRLLQRYGLRCPVTDD
jgi:DNA-binding NtrC family response regulator